MEDIFDREQEIICEADRLLTEKGLEPVAYKAHFSRLLEDYKRLLKQMKTMVKMSDIMQSKLNSLSGELEKLSQTDGLTGLCNRRFLNELYQREWNKAMDEQTPLGVLMVDIDYFKKYNDTFGHLAGDICLQKIAGALEETVKKSNTYAGRYGGEEFLVLLPGMDMEQCAEAAQHIMDTIKTMNIPCAAGLEGRVSVSIGIGRMIPVKGAEPDSLINAADQALYRAKKEGRNCYRIW